jgi:hypothetical protein
MENIILEFLNRPIAYHPVIAKAFDSVTLAVLWCQIYYWSDKTKDPEGWIYKTREDIFNETGLSRRQQETARRIGQELGVMDSVRKGKLGVMHFRVDTFRVCELVKGYIEKSQPKSQLRIVFKKEPIVKKEKEIPEWLDKKAWAEWEAYRREKGKKITTATEKKQLALLEKNKEHQAEIIEASIISGWQGLFPFKGKTAKTTDGRLHDGGRVEMRYGRWVLKDDPTVRIDERMYPEMNGKIISEEDWQKGKRY